MTAESDSSVRSLLQAVLPGNGGGAPAALLLIELQRMDSLVETLGPRFGEAVLEIAAERVRRAGGDGATVAMLADGRLGAVLQDGERDVAAAVATRLADLLSRTYLVSGQVIHTEANIGVVLLPGDAACAEQAVRHAGLALRAAKAAGRSGWTLYEPALGEASEDRRSLEVDLRRALALREFDLVYQPQLHLATRRVTGFEALLRWTHPVRGVVGPAHFIPLAESTGLIVPIGAWALRRACREAAAWPDGIGVAVNVSVAQFAGGGLPEAVAAALADSGLAPARLEVEITESLFLHDGATAIATLHELRALGVRVAMDDFGTGYSSLGFLSAFPFDKIKIDQSFVRGAMQERTRRAIVRAVATLGGALDMRVIAEGVETTAHLAEVMQEGCTDVQGYLLSRPLPAAAIATFLEALPDRMAGLFVDPD